jgi:hypothetical protein
VEVALFGSDSLVIDRCVAKDHDALGIEVPVLISVGSVPLIGVIAVFIGETTCDVVVCKCPEFFDEPVVELPIPLPGEEVDDLFASNRKLSAVAPMAIN